MYFMMKKDVPVKKLLLDYCRRQRLVFREVNFLLNGSRFQPHLTPNELEMETGDEFEAMSPVLGGAGA
ncbi:putative Rad60/SUMO-like domain, Ubiquitin-like domain superfamily [Helianthus annuus]|nr:putative Rad60/SUMO-like domain, Ubiquitin-like domain superfamily [Helianthus annuus]KAJ0584310.1 putative Rad60/SUMO-like domain, Ubiquitin-like domain superfamily [Helianthus annuus]KAJ0746943.1 putative Rad60/SUMO-like domain, Ubiquitin-like domain superfamily [Helianthus annuus]